MSGTTMIVLIVFISVGFGALYDMYTKHLKFKERTLNANAASQEDAQQMRAQISKLESRIEVLEKIVTDEGYTVSQEINKL